MATTTTTYSCGHTAAVSTVGKDKTYTRQDICKDCAAQAARESAATAQREQDEQRAARRRNYRRRTCQCASGQYGGVCTCD